MGFGIATCTWIGVTDNYEASEGWCWIKDVHFKVYFGYIPVWISAVGIAIIDSVIAFHMIRSTREMRQLRQRKLTEEDIKYVSRHPPHISRSLSFNNPNQLELELVAALNGSSKGRDNEPRRASSRDLGTKCAGHLKTQSTDSKCSVSSRNVSQFDKEAEMESKFQGMLARLLLYPVLLAVLVIPGSYNMLCDMLHNGEHHEEKHGLSEFFGYAQRFCDPARGTLNAIVWVLSDIDVRTELLQKLRSSAPWWRANWIWFWYGIKIDENTLNNDTSSSTSFDPTSSYTLPNELGAAERRRTVRIMQRRHDKGTILASNSADMIADSLDSKANVVLKLSPHSWECSRNPPSCEVMNPLCTTTGTSSWIVTTPSANSTSFCAISSATLNSFDASSPAMRVDALPPEPNPQAYEDEMAPEEPVPYGHIDKDYILEHLEELNMLGDDWTHQYNGRSSTSKYATTSVDKDSLSSTVEDAVRTAHSDGSRGSFQYY
jgi:hypothetical protein